MSDYYYIKPWQQSGVGNPLTQNQGGGPDYSVYQPDYSSHAIQDYQQGAQHSLDFNVNRIASHEPGQAPSENTNLAGGIAAGLQGTAQVGADIAGQIQAARSRNTNVPRPYTLDQFGTPAYTLGQSQVQATSFNKRDAGRGLPLRSGITGATTGAAVGAAVGGGVLSVPASIVGGVIGGVAGTVGGLIGQHSARVQAQHREDQLVSNINAVRKSYDTQNLGAAGNYLDRQTYEDLLNRNPYNIPQGYYS